MKEVTITINGKEVQVQVDLTILKAAEQIGIDIPRLCYDEELSLSGACRLCVVEVEGRPNLQAACVTQVTEGMVIHTESPAVVAARRAILDLLLSDHPLDCLTCEKNGDCKLQEYCYRYGLKESSFVGERHHYLVDDSNPFIYRDMNKCIQCERCVRACAEITGQDNISFINRGFSRKVATYADKPFADSICTFCGNCVAVCPTGALIEKPMMGKGRRWELKRVKTTCPFCGTGCNFDLCVKDGKLVGVLSNPNSVVNGRALCIKGRFGWDYVNNEERLTTPLIKKNGKFAEASWDEAISLIATRLGEIKEKYGPNAFGALSSARCTNEENYLMQKFARAVMGTNNVDHCART